MSHSMVRLCYSLRVNIFISGKHFFFFVLRFIFYMNSEFMIGSVIEWAGVAGTKIGQRRQTVWFLFFLNWNLWQHEVNWMTIVLSVVLSNCKNNAFLYFIQPMDIFQSCISKERKRRFEMKLQKKKKSY